MKKEHFTCQICERLIRRERPGVQTIAHHGYSRPGWGRQTASCFGARELPYELSCDLLRQYVGQLAERIDRLQEGARGPITAIFTMVDKRYARNAGKSEPVYETITEETLPELAAKFPKIGYMNGLRTFYEERPATWAELVARQRARMLQQADELSREHHHQHLRLERWHLIAVPA